MPTYTKNRTDPIDTAYLYDSLSGLLTMTTAGGVGTTMGFDTWARPTSYTDSLGTSTSTTYNGADKVATINDGSATYSVNYDSHGMIANVDAGGGVGSFGYAFAVNGDVDTITYPNGVVAENSYNEIGERAGVTYSQGTTQLMNFTQTRAADGHTLGAASAASEQKFGYDQLGRLTKVEDTRANGCTTRSYGFDAASNRSSLSTYGPSSTSACQTVAAAGSRTSSFDSAGRITDTGYVYDVLGRTTSTPQVDAGPSAASALSATYRPDDMVASMSQSVTNSTGGTDARMMAYELDPDERIKAITTSTNGIESLRQRFRYAGDTDSPSMMDESSDGGATWNSVRYINLPEIGMVASSSAGVTTNYLANLHGDLVATMANIAGDSQISSYSESDEYGNAIDASHRRYAWLGASQRSSDALGELVLMGARLYNPVTGSFLSSDPEPGGNLTSYTYPLDPIGMMDVSGRYSQTVSVHTVWTGLLSRVDYGHVIQWGNRSETRQVLTVQSGILTALGLVFAWLKIPSMLNKLLAVAGVANLGAALDNGFRIAIRYNSIKVRSRWQSRMNADYILEHVIGGPMMFIYRV